MPITRFDIEEASELDFIVNYIHDRVKSTTEVLQSRTTALCPYHVYFYNDHYNEGQKYEYMLHYYDESKIKKVIRTMILQSKGVIMIKD